METAHIVCCVILQTLSEVAPLKWTELTQVFITVTQIHKWSECSPCNTLKSEVLLLAPVTARLKSLQSALQR